MPAAVCQKCGFNSPTGMRFCGNCGTRLPVPTAYLQSVAPLPEDLPGSVGVMMGANLAERFRQAGIEAAGQRRNVTILFVDLAGYTGISHQSDDEETYLLVQQFINLMARDVYKYDGMVDKFLGDGLMAIFGAPIAHENNAELAVRAALDMHADGIRLSRELSPRLGTELRLHIGLHSGSVVVGSLGSNLLMNYTAIGDTVNLAYRLLQEAPAGSIYASQSVYQEIHGLVDFEPLAALALKGFPDPVPAYAVVQLKSKPGSARGIEGMRAPLIGRDAEMTQLRRAQQALIASKEGRFILIQGEAGIGKSRLTEEFCASMEKAGLRCLVGHSFIYRRLVSYWIFQELFHTLLDLPMGAPEASLRTRLAQTAEDLLGSQSDEALPYLEYLLSLKPSSEEAAERLLYLDAAELRQQVFLAARDLLVAEARQSPLVLVFEDLHWADEASLDLICFLVDSVRQEPLLAIAIARPSSETALRPVIEKADRVLSERFTILLLQSLSARQSERLFHELLSGPNLPEDLCQRIIQRSAGNPFYLEEIVRMLIDDRLIYPDEGKWKLAPGAEITPLGVPDTLQGLILARFDRLSPLERRILQVASVIGRTFDVELLQEVLPPTTDLPIPSALGGLIERGFIQPPEEGVQAGYAFSHTLVADAIYATLLKNDRTELHGQVGTAIEKLLAGRIDEQVELLARHYSWSNRPDRALHYLVLAGQKAARGYANTQARQNFEQALGILKTLSAPVETIVDIHTGLGDVLNRIGDYPAARSSYLSALDAADSKRKTERARFAQSRSYLYRKIGTTHERQGDYAQALNALAAAQSALDDVPDPLPVERAWILNDTGWTYFRRGDLDAAENTLLEALRLVEDSHHYDLVASVYNRLGGVCYQKDQLEQATNYVRRSLFLRQVAGDTNAVARSYNNLGLLRWKRGDWDSALDNFMRSLKLHATLGDVEGSIELHSNLGLLQIDRGNFDEAQKHLKTGLAAAEQIGQSYHIGLLYLNFSRLCVMREDWQKALEYCREGLKLFNEMGVVEHLVDLNTYTGMAWLGLGDLNQAQGCAEQGLFLFNELNPGNAASQAEDRGRALRLLGQVSLARQDYQLAEGYLQESDAIFKAVGNQIEQGRTACVLAALSLAREEDIAARVALNQARLIFRQLGARVDLRRVDALAAHLPN